MNAHQSRVQRNDHDITSTCLPGSERALGTSDSTGGAASGRGRHAITSPEVSTGADLP